LTQTRPVPHCELKRQVSAGAVQTPPMQVWPFMHWSLLEQGQLDEVLVHTGREHAPSMQSAPPEHSAFVRHAPGFRVGVRSVGATQMPRVVPDAPRQTQP
jgi:hypothetical protein